MGDLRKNFSKKEFKCKHCGVYKDMDPSLLDGLQMLSDNTKKSIGINSGYRCKNHPIEKKKIDSGKPPGEHSRACAADIKIEGLTSKQVLAEVLKIPQFKNAGIGIYPGKTLTHVDTKPGGPRRWSYINNVERSFEDGLKLLK